MHRHPSVPPCRKRMRSGSFWFRMTRIIGYLGLALAALSSTLLFPYFLSIFRPHAIHSGPYEFQKRSPHLSRNVQSRERKDFLDFKKEPIVELKLIESLQGQSDSNFGKTFSMDFKSNHFNRPRNILDGWNLVNGGDFKKLWKPLPDRGFAPCVSPGKSYSGYTPRGYLLVHANGGLNQMRAGICDMVAVARLINATLVIPELDKRSFWQDSSIFSDVFDEEYFIKALEKDVPVVKKLPKVLLSGPRANKQFRSWSGVEYYKEEIARLWEDYKVIRASKSDSRLANNNLPSDIQKLRCRVHYDALRFSPAIEALGKNLVERMRSDGPFIALHLRYEKDMLAFSGCTYGLSDLEIEELTMIRENTPHWKVKLINSTEQRVKGLCPLTPKEVGVFLQALGYPSSTRIYIAAGEIYGGNSSMVELRNRFPNLMCKETIATGEELAPFRRHASQMAALDYIVSVESDVFIPSYSGNMARAVEGHRRFLGHRKTISPDRRRLVGLFDQLDSGLVQEGNEFSSAVIEIHSKRQGAPRKRKGPLPGSKGKERFRTEEAFYTNPLPDCICQKRSLALDAKHLAHDRAH